MKQPCQNPPCPVVKTIMDTRFTAVHAHIALVDVLLVAVIVALFSLSGDNHKTGGASLAQITSPPMEQTK